MDRNSSNGVRVNDQFITPSVATPLRNGDCLMIGSIKLMYYESYAAIPKQQAKSAEDNLKLVTILPSLNDYDDKIAIKEELEEENVDFKKVELVTDINVLKEDYEKLRLAYELSKITLTNDLSVHLEKSLDLIFEILLVDRGVVLLVDQNTGTLATHHVRLRSSDDQGKEIILSSTILKRVYESRKCLVTTDASQEKSLQAAKSVLQGKMRSVVCLPLVGHNKVLYSSSRYMELFIWMRQTPSPHSPEKIYQLLQLFQIRRQLQ
jgi:adenylate cyclase